MPFEIIGTRKDLSEFIIGGTFFAKDARKICRFYQDEYKHVLTRTYYRRICSTLEKNFHEPHRKVIDVALHELRNEALDAMSLPDRIEALILLFLELDVIPWADPDTIGEALTHLRKLPVKVRQCILEEFKASRKS